LTLVARDVISDLEVQINETSARVEVGHLPTVDADRAQMYQLLQNLVGNAIKFRHADRAPRVRISGRVLNGADGASDANCEVAVEDNGIGFEEDYRDRIFVVFQRLHTREAYAGTGIGLAVCRKIVDRHGGSITAHSQPGQGSTFTVRLPVTQSENGDGSWQ
jgi:light-regulated signal transduction histidine kinase (bacteriophytochrome)